jgi:hypothetical protein
VALFFTVLVDQVCYSHFRGVYEAFRRLTEYPKFKGDCPGACSYHLHPSRILSALNRPTGAPGRALPFEYAQLLGEGIPVMRREVEEFRRDHLPTLDAGALWDRCLAEVSTVGPTSDATDGGR